MRASKSRFKKTVLENGLTIVSESHPEFRSLSMGIWVKTGTRFERPREAGVSHFLEHMLFKGTEHRTAFEISRAIDAVGGEFNAFTDREYTCFHVLLLNDDVALGVDVLCDVLLHSVFDPGELEVERKVILQEIAMTEESPEELATDLYFEKVYGRHGLGRQILGSESSVRRMRRGDLLRYFRKHYRPDQLIVSVAGDISHDSVVRRFRPLLRGRWPGRPHRQSQKELGFQAAPLLKNAIWWEQRSTEQVHLIWGVEAMKYTGRDRLIGVLLNTHLGVGMSSMLFQEIREKNGLAYTVYSTLSSFRDSGTLWVYAGTTLNQTPVCIRLIEECVARLCKDLLTEEELESAKNNLKGTLLLAADNVESRMSSIAKAEIFFGSYFSVEEICGFIDRITPQDIRRVARKIFGHGKRSLLALGPRPTPQVLKKVRGLL